VAAATRALAARAEALDPRIARGKRRARRADES